MEVQKLSDEVRLLAESKLGKPLKPEYVVHIRDKDAELTKQNIMIFASKKDYERYVFGAPGKFEFKLRFSEDVIYSLESKNNTEKCDCCGIYFNPKKMKKHNDKKFCGKTCLKKYIYDMYDKLPLIPMESEFYKKEKGGYYRNATLSRMLASINFGFKLNSLVRSVYLNRNHYDTSKENLVVMSSADSCRFLRLRPDAEFKIEEYDIGVKRFIVTKPSIIPSGKNKYKHTCKYCCREFHTQFKDSKYCNMECRDAARRGGLRSEFLELPNPYKADVNKIYTPKFMRASLALGFIIPNGYNPVFLDKDCENMTKENILVVSRSDNHRWNRCKNPINYFNIIKVDKNISRLEIKDGEYKKTCLHCGKEFVVERKDLLDTRKFCSRQCAAIWQHQNS